MSKMNDMAMTIEELRNAAAAINDAANWLAQQFGGTSETAEKAEVPAAPAKPTLTLEEVRAVLAVNVKADKEKSTEKIDGAVATIMGLDRAIRCGNNTDASVYDDRGILFL